ncbi:hypothetical protein VCHA53O466_140214 [Vibrio chagasii]|nr:hypothetical protein VCHA53O466_140214 [Vibrio chagasii]
MDSVTFLRNDIFILFKKLYELKAHSVRVANKKANLNTL